MKVTPIFYLMYGVICLLSGSLYANQSENEKDENIKQSPKNQENIIQVYAQKHIQNKEDIAVSITVISGESISEQNIKDTTALSGQAANFKITQNAAEGTPPAVNIRGVGSFDYNTSTTSPVGVYLDNVAGGSANSQLINLFDVESVEILRGPQGTLFGRNTTAGAVLIRSRRPENDNSGYFIGGLAEQNQTKLQAAVNLPISDNVASRLAFSYQDYDYSVNNLYPSAPQAGMQQTQGRWSFLGDWQDLQIFAKVHAEKWDGTVQPVGNIGVISSFDPLTGQPASLCSPAEAGTLACTDAFGFNDGSTNFYDVSVNNDINGNSPHQTDSWGVDGQLSYRLSEKNHIESISSYNTLDRVHFYNSDGSPARAAEGGQNVYTKVKSQEIRLHSQLDKLYLINGFYYLDESIIQDNFIDLLRDFRAVPQLFASAATFFYDNKINTTSIAIFSHGEYQITDQTSLTAGLRYSKESTNYGAIGNINVALSTDDQTGLTVPGWDVSGEINDNNLSGKIAINHKFSPQVSGFSSFSRGFKSGGYNGALVFSAEEALRNDYGAETLDAYEIGSRFNWDERNARLDLSVFYYDYKDQQVFMNQQAIDAAAPPIQLLDNVGKSTIYGAELDLQWQLSSAFKSQLMVGYLPEANLQKFVDAAGNEIKNNRLPFTSKWNISGFADYVITLQKAELILQLNFDYQSKYYFDQNQNPYASQESYTLWNGRIAYQQQDWTVALWGKNLTNQQYSHLKFDLIGFFGMLQDFKGEARQIGFDISYTF